MPFGFDDAAALLSLVGFTAAAFQACAQGLILISRARCYCRDVSGIKLMFELELHKLYSWAIEVGLTQQPPVLQIDAQYGPLVSQVIQHLKELVTDVEKLNQSHGLHLQETSDHLITLDGDETTALERLGITSSSDNYENFLKQLFKQRKKPWKVLKWVAFEEQKVRNVLSQIGHFTKELQGILDRTRQAKMAKSIDIMLRSAVSSSANEQDLDMIGLTGSTGADLAEGNIAAAARLKKRGLLLGVMDPVPPHTPTVTTSACRRDSKVGPSVRKNSFPPLTPRYLTSDLAETRLSAGHFRLSSDVDIGRDCRTLAHYNDKPVLLEFRNNTSLLDRDQVKERVCKVSVFLRDLDPSFHGLCCLGYVKICERYAYVFSLQEIVLATSTSVVGATARTSSSPPPSYRTLRALLDEAPCPSLNLRLSFAITVLEAVLQLHTSGWLHKEFRSENTLFILSEASSADGFDEFLHSTMRIMGYAHARADDLYEMTEPLKSELEADLYRHPACLRQPRELFRRSFDMFSVGCMLLEIGCWSSLTALLQTYLKSESEDRSVDLLKVRDNMLLSAQRRRTVGEKGPTSSKTSTIDDGAGSADILRTLGASTGETYSMVVKTLLYASDNEEDSQSLLHVEMECLEKLKAIAEVV